MTGDEALADPVQPAEPLDGLATRCARLAAAVELLAEGLRGDRRRLEHAWTGRAAEACDAELAAVVRLLGRLPETLHRAGRLLRGHAAELEEARNAVAALRREYDDVMTVHRLAAVASAGAVPQPPGAARELQADDAAARCSADLAAVHARHRAVLDRVAAHAQQTAAAVSSLVDAAAPVRSGLDSAGDAALLAALPMLARHSAVLGARRGLPASVRGAANELLLDRQVQSLGTRRSAGGVRMPWLLGSCLAVTDALAQVRAHRDPVSGARMTASLLVFRPAAFGGQGRVAVVAGDLDRADNVALLVPGLGSTVGGTVRGLAATAALVTSRARLDSPREVTATIAWMAYDAPNLLQVARDDAARAGGGLLAADLRGVRTASGAAQRVTVVGHSYGSTTVGAALRHHRTGITDAVLLGSPGAGVQRASELRIPAGHVWVGAASRDPVSYLDRFGTDPAHRRFGATRFAAEDVARHPLALSIADHSRYFAAGGESLANVVQVVVGDYDDVGVVAFRREQAWLPDGISTDPEADRRVGMSW